MRYIPLILFLALAGCQAGSDDDSSVVTQAVAAATHADAKAITALSARLDADEKQLALQSLVGHVPGVSPVSADAGGRVTEAVVDTTDYGICSDMGQHVANSLPPNVTHDAFTGDPIDVFKQCTGNKYLVDTESGAIATVETIWFTDTTCGSSGGNAIEFEADGVFDRPTLQGGIVFKSPMDGSVVWVQPLALGAVAQQLTSHSTFTGSACLVSTETHAGYLVVPNVTDGTTGTGVPDDGVPATYVYN